MSDLFVLTIYSAQQRLFLPYGPLLLHMNRHWPEHASYGVVARKTPNGERLHFGRTRTIPEAYSYHINIE